MGNGKGYALLAVLTGLSALQLKAQDASRDAIVAALPRPGAIEILNNERGRVWDVIYPPGMSTGMHRHPSDFVGVELVDTELKLTSSDGKEQIRPIRRGQIYMQPQGLTHNTSQTPDGFAAAGAKRVADNARVILWDATWPQGEAAKSFFQTHDMFLVPIDVGILSITSTDEPERSLPVAAGQVVFLGGGHLRTIRSTQGSVRAAVVELK
jgi:hypothetical protein